MARVESWKADIRSLKIFTLGVFQARRIQTGQVNYHLGNLWFSRHWSELNLARSGPVQMGGWKYLGIMESSEETVDCAYRCISVAGCSLGVVWLFLWMISFSWSGGRDDFETRPDENKSWQQFYYMIINGQMWINWLDFWFWKTSLWSQRLFHVNRRVLCDKEGPFQLVHLSLAEGRALRAVHRCRHMVRCGGEGGR